MSEGQLEFVADARSEGLFKFKKKHDEQITALEARCEELTDALEFYASKFKYGSSWSNTDVNHVMEDKGKTARKALSTTPQEALDRFENEIIERCALVATCNGVGERIVEKVIADEIRALKKG